MRAYQWMKVNFFSSWISGMVSIVCFYCLWQILSGVLDWVLWDAIWGGNTSQPCLDKPTGLCWGYVRSKWMLWIYGRYPEEFQWRVNVCFGFLFMGMLYLRVPKIPSKGCVGLFLVSVFPVLAFWLLYGGFGLEKVETTLWGGLLLTLVISFTGIVASFPLGVLLALGRRSEGLPVIRWMCILFIEFWRGVPLITVLFMASVVLPFFLPQGVYFDKLLRALVSITLFSSAYMAEVIRGGLQAIPKGQIEASQSLGFGYWKTVRLIVLPQALRVVIPGIVNTFIGLFKDTTLVLIIGLFDILGIVQLTNGDPNWTSPVTASSGYFIAGFLFWIFCFNMSRYSQSLEKVFKT